MGKIAKNFTVFFLFVIEAAPQPDSRQSLTQKMKKSLLKGQSSRGRKKITDLERVLTEPHSVRPPILCELCGAKKFEHESKGFVA